LFGQTYKAKQVDTTLEKEKEKVTRALKSGNVDADRMATEKFFKEYYFPRWTDPANKSKLYTYRSELLRTDLRDASGNARAYLLSTAFGQLSSYAADDTIFPAARFNAMLSIGMLNEKEGDSASSAPTPYRDALPYLMKEYEKTNNPPFIKIAALEGIVRHAQCGIANEANKNEVAVLLRKVIKDGAPQPAPTTRNEDEQQLLDWGRTLALQGLQGLKSIGAKAETVDLLLTVIESENESPEFRFAAIRAIGDLDFAAAKTGGISVNLKHLTDAIFLATMLACETELKNINDAMLGDPSLGSARGGSSTMDSSYSSSMGMSSGSVTGVNKLKPNDVINNSIARVKTSLFSVRNAIQGKASSFSSNPDATGITPLLEGEPALNKKMRALRDDIVKTCEYLDKGPAESTKTGSLGLLSGSSTPSSSDSMSSSTTTTEANVPKVTLAMIEMKLKELYTNTNERKLMD
jgi:hypothetical protein